RAVPADGRCGQASERGAVVGGGDHPSLGPRHRPPRLAGDPAVRCEVLAVGTELLLGQIVDTNSTWVGERLAEAGIDSYEHRQVGDNLGRMTQALRELLARSDAVIVCGGLGPTPDDLTRDAIAEVMGVELERREDLIEWVSALFRSRGREMPE